MIDLSINNQKIKVEKGVYLLRAIEELGIKIPTLCYYKALTPYGSCRLCVVEVHVPGRAPSLQASCSYPILIDGINVFSDTERVKKARKIVAELLLARCPDSDIIKRIAAEHGVKELRIKKKYDDCIYCGLCVRICKERMGRNVIGFSGRGVNKKLEPPFGKSNEMCWTCGACNFICPTGKKVLTLTSQNTPIPIPNLHNLGLDQRPAVYIPYPQAVPNKPVIDKNYCIHMKYGLCGICSDICEAKAINYEQKDEKIELNTGAIILTPGYEIFDARIKKELGYGNHLNVITSLEFERILSPSGPYAGKVLRPSDRKTPKRIAFIQCVGSRDFERDYCSAVCCMYASKEAIIAKEHIGEDLECDIFFMDIRAYSKGFEEYYQKAKKLGVNYIRYRIHSIEEISVTKNLIIKYLTENDRKVFREYDLVVLSVGIQPPKEVEKFAEKFGIELNEFNFCKTSVFKPTETNKEGIFVAGPFTEPRDIPETVILASAAASKVQLLLNEVRWSLIVPKEYPSEIDITGKEPRIGVFVCHCGTNIAGVVNVPDVVVYAKTLPNVVYAENNLYSCSNDSQEKIKHKIKEYNLNRVIVASCTPRTHEALFRNTMKEVGLNPYLFEMANIRDQCSWVHMSEPEKATKKAKDLVRMAAAKAKLLDPLQKKSIGLKKSALIIGGGLSGLVSARELANMGFEVYLIEKERELGGNLKRIHYLMNGEKLKDKLKLLIEETEENEKIHIFTEAKIEHSEGSVGNFKTKIRWNGSVKEFEHGVVIVSTGAKELKPGEYFYGQDERILTQSELEQHLAKDANIINGSDKNPKTIVMILCVGSRNKERPYCSRICCSESIKTALKIKEVSPKTDIYILYRDIRTYGFRESFYTKARQKSVRFIRYEEDNNPQILKNKSHLSVKVFDQILNMEMEIPADLIILSAGIVPYQENKEISQFFKIPLNQDGFFLEAHMKLRPVEFATDGVFVCGLSHSAKSIEESIAQAQAASTKASAILSKDYIDLEANISSVIDENCDGCAYCIEPCPYHAITLIEYMWRDMVKKVVEVNDSICKGCGTCMATCPKKGTSVKGFTIEQIGAQIEAALQPI